MDFCVGNCPTPLSPSSVPVKEKKNDQRTEHPPQKNNTANPAKKNLKAPPDLPCDFNDRSPLGLKAPSS